MKKLILSAIAVFAFTFAQAQEESGTPGFAKGDLFISGAIGINSEETGDFKTSSFTIAPRAGYFLTENIAAGLRLGYTARNVEQGNADFDVNTFQIGAFGRYYATPTNRFSLFGELGFGYFSTDDENFNGSGQDVTVDGFDIGVRPGISYFFSNNFAVEALIGALSYRTSEPDINGAESTDTFDFSLDLENINLGLIYKF
ncbi:outer membrane beta-barrel protein [Aquimarina algicola]|uniref:Porin family protein n=1 Tax=Aquimarina algicola TaxID=2589995 RepID=A0A504JJL5_9FLAO|nr:outer membrane beta-barrel protein [Aquimarina algicola]TPN88982.1 porin family protein [Aquimarina algicola]